MIVRRLSVNQSVWSIIENDISIKKCLARDVINIRSLAKFILKGYSINSSLDSIISALRRYKDSLIIKSKSKDKVDINLFKNSTIKTKDNVFCLVLSKEANVLGWFNKIGNAGKSLRVITGEDETRLFLHNSLIDSAKDFFPKQAVIEEKKGLAEINLVLLKEVIKTKGILARIASEIALQDINIEETIISPPEFCIYVRREDLIKAHEALFKITNNGNNK